MHVWLLVSIALLPMTLLSAPTAAAQVAGLQTVSAAATLTILTGAVRHLPRGARTHQAAVDGMNLAAGDRIVTGPESTALVTFLDGSTVTVERGSDVTVKRAEVGDRTASAINVQIHLGTVWARVVRLLEPRSALTLESNAYTATAHDGLIGGQQSADGTFVCWTTAGTVSLASADGRSIALLHPGDKATLRSPGAPLIEPFAVNRSTLEVTTSPGVLPLLQVPGSIRVIGFVTPGVEVNQVFGSFSGTRAGRPVIEVPAGSRGPFTLALEGRQSGPFAVHLIGRYRGAPVYEKRLAGTIAAGERLTIQIVQYLDPRSPDTDPRTIEVQGARVSAPQAFSAPLPGRVLLSPREVNARAGH